MLSSRCFRPLLLLHVSLQLSAMQPENDIEDKSSLFDEFLLKRYESEDLARFHSQGRFDEIRHKVGTLAVYFRLFKELLPMEQTIGYQHVWPSQVDLHSDLAVSCSSGLEACLNYISSYLRTAHPWLTGEDGSHDETELRRERMEQIVNDNAVSLEVSSSQLLCWLTLREVQVFERIPFCDYTLLNEVDWPAKLFHSHPDYLDDLTGEPFACAKQSFCPDPCCLDVDANSLQFTKPECQSNVCQNPHRCYIQSRLNDDLLSMRQNKWNISCPCGNGLFFRSDVAQCVHENVCAKEELCGQHEECLNVMEGRGFKCVCQLGYVKGNHGCVTYGFAGVDWNGPALTERSSSFSQPLFWTLVLLISLFHA